MAIRNKIQDDANELFHEYNRVELIKKYIHDNIKSDFRSFFQDASPCIHKINFK